MKHNFGAGPCILPQEVFQEASKSVVDFNGLSILEVSHRHKDFVAVMDEATALVKKALNVPDGYSVIFLQGGASLGFLISALNMMRDSKKASYINTGAWSKKAMTEAKKVGFEVIEAASSSDKNFNYIPKNVGVDPASDYLHFTSNNTIFGTQFKEMPNTDVPLVCDMSSDIFSREINVADFDMIYAGAQKNMGPAGTTVVVVKEEILGKVERTIPSMLNYKTHISKESMFNTPAVFPIYVSMLTLEWLKDLGGISFIEKVNNKKANLLYKEIDRNPLFRGIVAKEDRSIMNATFSLIDDSLTNRFDALWKEARINGLNGHRSVGGYRASMYNALPLFSVQALVDTMQELERKA